MEVPGKTASNVIHNCDLCAEGDENIPAETYCPVCDEYLCTPCATTHQRSRSSRNHQLVEKESVPRKRSEKDQEYVNEYCRDHPRELVKYYCPIHGDLLCGDCIVTNNHTCKMEVISNVSKGYENSAEFKQHEQKLKTITDNISKTKHEIDLKAVSTEDSKKQSVKQVRTFQAELINAINNMSDEITADIECKAQATHAILSNLKTTSKTGELEVYSVTNVIENCKGNDVLLFIAVHRTQEIANNLSNKIDEVENALESVPQYKFIENAEAKTHFKTSSGIGHYKQALQSDAHTDTRGK